MLLCVHATNLNCELKKRGGGGTRGREGQQGCLTGMETESCPQLNQHPSDRPQLRSLRYDSSTGFSLLSQLQCVQCDCESYSREVHRVVTAVTKRREAENPRCFFFFSEYLCGVSYKFSSWATAGEIWMSLCARLCLQLKCVCTTWKLHSSLDAQIWFVCTVRNSSFSMRWSTL